MLPPTPSPSSSMRVPPYPRELDGSTWLTSARRDLAESSTSWPNRSRDAAVPSHWSSERPEAVASRLETLVSDLASVSGSRRIACDLRSADADLAESFRLLRGHVRAGDRAAAVGAGEDILAALSRIARVESPERLCKLASLDDKRASHMLDVLSRAPHPTSPEGTVAYALGTLEALAFRLATSGRLSRAATPTLDLDDALAWNAIS